MYWVSDSLIRIKNALIAKKQFVDIRGTKMVLSILEVLKKEHFILDYKITDNVKQVCSIKLFYNKLNSVISEIKIISKPSLRKYCGYKHSIKCLKKFGCPIISTSFGVMSGKEAYEKKLGGELLCEVYS